MINPSMWSAPIEGALIKSSCNNPNIATVITQYGFETVFDGAINHLHLSSDAIVAARQISNFLSRKPRIIS